MARGKVSLGLGFSVGKNAVAKGGLECAGEWVDVEAGDGAGIEGERKVVLRAETSAEVLVFDLP